MKKLFFYFIIAGLAALSACTQSPQTNTHSEAEMAVENEKAKANISELLDQLANSTETGNMSLVEKIWCPKEETMLIGTENNEKLMGWTAIKDAIQGQFSKLNETLISITDQNIWISKDGGTAWFFEELNYNFIYKDHAMSIEGIRFTGVFIKNSEGAWKLVQGHMSAPSSLDVAK
jgi:ketosteroid isomerase-like protein